MADVLHQFFTALLALFSSTGGIWLLARSPRGSGPRNVVMLGIAMLTVWLALCLVALAIPPLWALKLVLLSAWCAGLVRLYLSGPCAADRWFAAALVLCAVVSALLPDREYVPWDNYTHWALAVKSFEYGRPLLGNDLDLFPTYPPLQPLMTFFMQGIVPFSLGNLQTHRVAILAYLACLMVLGASEPTTKRRLAITLGLVFALLIGLSARLLGDMQSGYADFGAAALTTAALVAGYRNAATPNRELRLLASLSIAALPLLRPGMLIPAILLAVALVLGERLGLLERRSTDPATPPMSWAVNLVIVLAPLASSEIWSVIALSWYGMSQNTPASLVTSFIALADSPPAFRSSVFDALVVSGTPLFGSARLTLALIFAAIPVLAIVTSAIAGRRSWHAAFYMFLIALVLAWTAGVTLQMAGFFGSRDDLPSFTRYLGIMLMPGLAAAVVPLCSPSQFRTASAATIALAVLLAGTVILHLSLARSNYWRSASRFSTSRAISERIRPLVGDRKVWIVAAPDPAHPANSPGFRIFSYKYYLMPARVAGSGSISRLPVVAEASPSDFANFLASNGYDWVLVDDLGPQQRNLIAPLTVAAQPVDLRSGRWMLFRVERRPGSVHGVALRPVFDTRLSRPEQEAMPFGLPH